MEQLPEREQRFYEDGDVARTPATSAGLPDPTSVSSWSDEERAAIGRRKLGPSDWVLLASFFCTLAAVVVTASAARGPHVDPEVDRPRVREAVVDHLMERAGELVDLEQSAFCVSLFGSIDPVDSFIARFADHEAVVLPVSRCIRGAPELYGRHAFDLVVGKMQWIYGGYVQVVVGDERRDLYTLKRRDDGWQVIRIEPAWR